MSSRQKCIEASRKRLADSLKAETGSDELLARFDRWSEDLYDGLAAVYSADDVLPGSLISSHRFIVRAHLSCASAMQLASSSQIGSNPLMLSDMLPMQISLPEISMELERRSIIWKV